MTDVLRSDRPRYICKVGKKIVTQKQRRILAGLDVSCRSIDTTAESQQDSTLDDTWLGGMGNNSKKRLELIKQRRSLTRRIGRMTGGDFNQFTMPVPPFDPQIEVTASCSEDSDEEEGLKPDEQDNQGGSQGRRGEGCSTPRNVNNTLAALREIEISVVSFNSSANGGPAPPVIPIATSKEGNNTVEMVDVHSTTGNTVEMVDVDTPKEMKPQLIDIFKKPMDLGKPVDPAIQSTFVIEEHEIDTTGGTYTIRVEEDIITIKDAPETSQMPQIRFPAGVQKPQINAAWKQNLLSALPHEQKEEKPVIDRKSSLLSENRKSLNKRQSVQFATDALSPASRSFGFSTSRLAKNPRVVTILDTPKPLNHHDTPEKVLEETLKTLKVSGKRGISSQESVATPNESLVHDTPKRGNLSLREGFTTPRYAQPTVASMAKSPRISNATQCRHYASLFEDSSSEASSTFIEIDPSQTMVEPLLKSGYRPRHVSKLQIQQKLKEVNGDFDDDQAHKSRMEEKRSRFMERRLNETKPIAPLTELDPIEDGEENKSATATAMVTEGAPLEDEAVFKRSGDRSHVLSRNMSAIDEFDMVDPYGDDVDIDTSGEDGIVIRQRRNYQESSVFSPNVPSPLVTKKKKLRHLEDSVVEDCADIGEMILKPRKLIHPTTPDEPNVRRSTRTRLPPLRQWLGEQAVYVSSPGGSQSLKGVNRVQIKDPRYIRTRTTDPVKALERERRH